MNSTYINPFLEATISLFESIFAFTPMAGAPFLDEKARKHRWDISAVMILTGTAIRVVAIRLTRPLADKLLQKSGVTWNGDEERDDLMSAMVGEFVNIIAGNASGRLVGCDVNVSVPIVIQGENHTVSWPDRAPVIGVPFTTPYGPLLVDISLIELPKQYRK